MWLDVNDDKKITRRSAVRARLAFASVANAVALVNAGRDLDLDLVLFFAAPAAVADLAGFGDHLAGTAAGCARARHAEKALGQAHLARATAG